LNQVTPYDWDALLKNRVNAVKAGAPLGGIERGGWRLVYNDKPNTFIHAGEGQSQSVDASYSLGFVVKKDGEFEDVIYGSPAYLAGIGPGMKLVAVDVEPGRTICCRTRCALQKTASSRLIYWWRMRNSSRFIPFRITTASETRIWSAPKHPAPRRCSGRNPEAAQAGTLVI